MRACCGTDSLQAWNTGASYTNLGAQNVFWKPHGAYTGQISPAMLADLGVRYVILGHSERRGRFGVLDPDFDDQILAHFGDSDATVNRKLRACLEQYLIPIL